MNKYCIQLFALASLLYAPHAAAQMLTYRYEEQIFTLQPQRHWLHTEEITTFRGREVTVLRGQNPTDVERGERVVWDASAIARTLERVIGRAINRDAGTVHIGRDEDGSVTFDGVGLPGRTLDSDLAAALTVRALEEKVHTIQLPVLTEDPTVIVEDEALWRKGIVELVTVGESDFAGSPANRRHNIALGLARFNGHLVEQGEEFSFNAVLGPVNEHTGFREELTILGERTLPAYGGGLCQVSTTAYRGVWKAGFPITSRRNHSFAVRYYAPPGTDATIYPPWTDMRFVNDTDGALLLQTASIGDKAYFISYGTKSRDRSAELIGPFIWDREEPPEDRILETDEIPEGEIRIVSRPVPGMKAMWYRSVTNANGTERVESFFSEYEARPYAEEIGVTAALKPQLTGAEMTGDP